jgi:hypothetical protein
MQLQIAQHNEVVLERGSLTAELGDAVGVGFAVLVALGAEGFAGLGDLAPMVEIFDGLLEADGDQQAEDDGGDVDEEVAPGGGSVVGGVDVEHGGGFLGDSL